MLKFILLGMLKLPIPVFSIRVFFKVVNEFIFVMALADFVVVAAFGLVSPILAVYLTEQISNGSLEVIGFSSMIFFLTTALFRMPIAKVIDKNSAEYDDYYATLAGYFLISFIPFLYIFVSEPIHLYVVEGVHGLAVAMAYPGWMALFTRHIDKGKEGFSWSFYATSANIGAAIGAAVGGVVAQRVGFHFLFIMVGILSMIGTVCLLLNRKSIITKGHVRVPPRKEIIKKTQKIRK